MSDRDIPSVPVTTLAGLTSISDLLSELPVSDTLSFLTSLNKSLLFHPRVAEEANNLLAMRDDNLVKQLVTAIEQTNSDDIIVNELHLKNEGANSNNGPELLQAIYKIKPTIFDSQPNAKRFIQQHQLSHFHENQLHSTQISQYQAFEQEQINQSNYYQQQHQLQQNQINPSCVQLTEGNSEMNWHQAVNSMPESEQQQQQQHSIHPSFPSEQNQEIYQNYIHQQQPQQIQNENTHTSYSSIATTKIIPTVTTHQLQQQSFEISQQQPLQIFTHQSQFQQQTLCNVASQSFISPIQTSTQTTHHIGHQQKQVQVQQVSRLHNEISLQSQIQQQNKGLQSPESNQVDNNSFPSEIKVPTATVTNAFSNVQFNQQQPITQSLSHQQSHEQQAIGDTSLANESIANQKQYNIVMTKNSIHQNQIGVIRELIPQTQKVAPRNNEYLERQQQSKNLDLRGQSPGQAVNALSDSNQIHTFIRPPVINVTQNFHLQQECIKISATRDNNIDSKSAATADVKQWDEIHNVSSVSHQTLNINELVMGGKMPKVSLSRISKEDELLMQESLSKFVKKSPDLAKKLGIKDDETDENNDIGDSLFAQMKAAERKRKKLKYEENDILLTKPKLRKIEKIVVPIIKKLSKEDLLNSNTYQRFMSIMEKIFEQLDETDANLSIDDGDEASECISTSLLNSISSEAAKLKAKGSIDCVPHNKLSLLITYAMRSVTIAKNFSAGPDVQDDLIAGDYIEKITNAIEACLFICTIYSCLNVKFLQEDNLDTIIKFLQFQLRETIFPSFDPVYTVETKKKFDNKKKNKTSGHFKGIQLIYSKIVDLTKILVTIFSKFQFEDTIVIHASAVGVEPFFVDNIDTLQFVCLDLVTMIFQNEKYLKHRSNILSDILTSLDRLHGSKKILRPYKLANNAGNIQMVTALVLQLIQCSVVLPDSLCDDILSNNKKKQSENKSKIDKDMFIFEKYDTAMSIGGNFLQTFLKKCKPRSGETDFRPLFENFIYDLLTTVNKPEWPAAELLLSLLGTLLVKNMSDKSLEQSIRVVSLEYLGIVAARLRKDTVESRCKVSTMDQLIKYIKIEQEKEGDLLNNESIVELNPEEERTEFLQKILLDFLAVNAQEENIVWDHARHFYLTQWYKDIMKQKKNISEGEKGYASRKKILKKRRKYKSDSESSETDDDNEDDDSPNIKSTVDQELNLEIFRILEQRKKYLLSNIKSYSINSTVQDVKTYIDYSNAQLIAQYLTSKRSFSQSFDIYLRKILFVVWEQSIAIRTKAMKCLANIVEADPSILKRKEMQVGVNQKFLDASISVREAAVDLIGKYVLTSPELINQYYEMLSERILDTGVSVRKRVIKILRDICLEYPNFDKIPEICVKMIRRVNDEEGIQKLVTEVFLNMWFTPCNDNDKLAMDRKIDQITDVVSFSYENIQWLDGLLKSIFKPKENNDATKITKEPPKQLVTACQQIANGLVDAIMKLEGTDNRKLLGCITTLHLFAKIRPQLLVQHAITLEPYLNIKCHSNYVANFMSCVAEILEQVVPLMEHPSETFLADLEAHLIMLVLSQNQKVVISCVSCLGAIVNKMTKNYKLIRDCFKKFYFPSLATTVAKLKQDPNYPLELIFKTTFRRAMFTVGLLTRYFDFNSPEVYGDQCNQGLPARICDEIFDTFMFFVVCNNADIRKDSISALGYFCVKNYEYLTQPLLRDFYRDLLRSETVLTSIKVCVIKNILMYLNEEDQRMDLNEKEWVKQSKNENLKEMCDQTSGMAARVIQLYLKEILNCFLNRNFDLRVWSMKVIDVVLQQGLVHPVQIVPYLICLSTDPESKVSHCADRHLQEIEKQYPGFINMKSHAGIHLSFELQMLIQLDDNNKIVRGYRVKKEKDELPSSLNGFLYSLLRNAKTQRRALIHSIIKQFDDQKSNLRQMLYLADNLAYFPYAVQDEPLHIIHQIDVVITVTGTNLLGSFRDGLKPLHNSLDIQHSTIPLDEDDEDDKDILYNRLPENTTDLQKCITSAQGCMLLLLLKQHLKDTYGITDSKISRYSPSEPAKVYEKAMQRRTIANFNPKSTIDVIKEEETIGINLNESEKKELINRYLDFKQLMLKLDPEDTDNEDNEDKSFTKSANMTSKITDVDITSKKEKSEDVSVVHVNNINSACPFPSANVIDVTKGTISTHQNQLFVPSTPKTLLPKTARTLKKQTSRKKPKKKKISSSEDEDTENSDTDYI